MKIRVKPEVLARRMASRNISQNRWAQRLGISRAYLSMLLNGKRLYPGPAVRDRLLRALDLSFDDLFEVEGAARPRESGPRRWLPGSETTLSLHSVEEFLVKIDEDVRFTVRLLIRNPAFSVVAILTLSLGIATSTAIFSFANTLLWKPLPIPDGNRLVFLTEGLPASGLSRVAVSYADYRDWKNSSSSFASMAAYDTTAFLLQTGDGVGLRIRGVAVTDGFFELLGVPVELGSWLPPDEPDAVVLGHDLWQSAFGGDPRIVGKSIRLDAHSRCVVGVMPENFRFPERHQAWIPLREDSSWNDRTFRFLDVIAKLREDTSFLRAREEMRGIVQQLRDAYPESNRRFSLTMLPFREENVSEDEQLLVFVILGTTFLVLLIACANVSHLSLARAMIRSREMGIRSALGARPSRLIRLLLTEAGFLAVVAGGLGLGAGKWTKDLLVYSMPDDFPYWMDFSMDWRVYLFAAALILVCSLLFGLGPALKGGLRPSQSILHSSGDRATSLRGGWLRRALIVGELTLSMILVTGAALLMQTYLNSLRMGLGYDPHGVLTFHSYLPAGKYLEPERRKNLYAAFTSEIAHLPGVEGVTTTEWIPLQDFAGTFLHVEGAPARDPEEGLPVTTLMLVGWNYFLVARTPILEGRAFRPEDRDSDRRVAIVNQRLATTYWPHQSALGKRISLGRSTENTNWITIVGVVPDAHISDRNEERRMAAYVLHSPYPEQSMAFLVRSGNTPSERLLPALRSRLQEVDSEVAISGVSNWGEIVESSNWEETFFSWLFSLFSAMALALAAVGLYGVVAYMVSARRHEIGIRMAVGASRRDILNFTFSNSLKLAAAGILLGGVGAVVAGRLLEGLLVGVSPRDPITLLGTALLLLGVTLAATWIPARRASRTDPIEALRV